ncbi:CRAL-TRIO domain-containing protein [Lipomyces oligophaga]|uniref:CRAL-TRIO domain-containing protein n=1 Tax=Lipomyces oligophaga TaxID=45792 RepID=UPI0034CD39EE
MVRYVPFGEPLPSCKPPKRPDLTTDEQEKLDALLEYVRGLNEIPVSSDSSNKEKAPLDDEEQAWITRECLLRYLRATKWKLADAQKRVLGSLVWRREYGVRDLTPDYISPENESGKQLILGFDFDSRPCLYLYSSRQNTEKSNRQIQHLVFSLERVIDFMPSGQESLALLIDFKDSTNSKNPSVSQGRQVLHILQTHYPERLGKALVINIPWFVSQFLRIIYPFIDPLTREKLVFSEPIDKYVPNEQLDTVFGGSSDFQYDHSKYWNAMCEMAAEKHKRYMARWRELGGGVGQSEAELRAETDQEIQEEIAKTEALEKSVEAEEASKVATSSSVPQEISGNTQTAEEAAAKLDADVGLGEKAIDDEVVTQLSKVALAESSS